MTDEEKLIKKNFILASKEKKKQRASLMLLKNLTREEAMNFINK